MNATTAFLLGGALGLFAARLMIKSDSCCNRVADGVRDRVGEKLGSGAQAVGDVLGIWPYTPGLLDFFGVS